MKKIGIIFTMMIMSSFVWAGIDCPADSCNPYNGCLDGCSKEQLVCSSKSDSQCIGKEIYSICDWSVNKRAEKGFCNINSNSPPDACSCS